MRRKPLDRFEEKYEPEPNTGCWLWTAAVNEDGYGYFGPGGRGRMVKAHRFSYESHTGTIPDGAHVLHRCDVRCCVNPAHLFLGSHEDNMMDMANKRRASWGERSARAKLTEEQVHLIRAVYAEGQVSMRHLAGVFGVSYTTINHICGGKRWGRLLPKSDTDTKTS